MAEPNLISRRAFTASINLQDQGAIGKSFEAPHYGIVSPEALSRRFACVLEPGRMGFRFPCFGLSQKVKTPPCSLCRSMTARLGQNCIAAAPGTNLHLA